MKNLFLIILFGVFSLYSFSTFAWETPSANFTLKQSENNTTLQYKGKTLYQWSHISKKNPFIWDDGCEKLTDLLNKNIDKQKAWDSLGSQGQKNCIKESYSHSISVEKQSNERFFVVKRGGYESVLDYILFDSKIQKLYTKVFHATGIDTIIRIEVGKSGIYIQYSGARGNSGGLILIKNGSDIGTSVFSNTDNTNFITMKSFALKSNKRVKIIYSQGDNGEELEKIITLK